MFPGHYQPHIPADLGFYDLRLAEVREAQAELAKAYGIHGFCYYHYWFNGRRILERPFNNVLASGKPDFPFCLCWANENWTRTWDGGDKHILLEQNYSHEDDLAHIKSLIPAFRDERYIRVNGKPLLLVYRTSLLPNPERTASIWREAVASASLGDLYLVRVESFGDVVDPCSIGFDASVSFAPFGGTTGKPKFRDDFHQKLANIGLLPKGYTDNFVYDYDIMVRGMLNRPPTEWTHFQCVTPSWDNSARRQKNAMTFEGSTPEKYEAWLRKAMVNTSRKHSGDEKLVFINAWNEWAEGNHLEPDLRWGHAYLEATRNALTSSVESTEETPEIKTTEKTDSNIKQAYWRIRSRIKEQKELFKNLGFRRK